MVKADVCTCPLRPESDHQPSRRDPPLRASYVSRAANKNVVRRPSGRTDIGVTLSESCQPDVPKSRNEKAALVPSAGEHSHQGD
jgi:hypothetical protein